MATRRGVVTGRAAPLARSPWTRGVIVTLVFTSYLHRPVNPAPFAAGAALVSR